MTFEAGSAIDRRAAARALAQIGPQAEAAVPALVAALRDSDLAIRADAAAAIMASVHGSSVRPMFDPLPLPDSP